MKSVKKVLILVLILLIKASKFIYKIISGLWRKYNSDIKKIVNNLDEELRSLV